MANYRLYCFDGINRIALAFDIEADDDAKAVAAAKAKRSGVRCEVWQHDRLVARFENEA